MPEVENGCLQNPRVIDVWKVGLNLDERELLRTVNALFTRPDPYLVSFFLKHPGKLLWLGDFIDPFID